MAKVQGTFYTAERMRRGTSPVSPPYTTDEGQPYPVNPPGSNPSPAVEHNNTLNKQGGQEDEYYHLTEDQLIGLKELLSPPDIDRISQVGTITFDSATAISADDWKAIFSGIELDDTPITLDPVTGTPTDYSRIDSVYYKPDGTIGYETGAEDPDGAQFPPAIPDGTLRMADILRGTDGSNVIDYIDLQLDDFVSKSDTLLQTIQSNLAITPLAGSEPNYAVLGPNGQLYRSRTDQAGIFSTLQGSGGYSRILTINLNVPAQLNYYAVIEFHGVSAAYEKGFLWVQFEVDAGGDLVTNALKCFGEFDVSKYKLVKVDADHYDLFVAHVGANDFYKFRPLANFGGSSIYTYYQLPTKVDPLPDGDDYGFTLHTTGVQSVTGDGVGGTAKDIVLAFPTPAEIGAQDDLGTDINAALIAANVPSGTNPIATMADVGGGGADTNAVHYNAADGKSATERQQARQNIGATSAPGQIVSTAGAINDLTATSNNIVLTGASPVLSGIVAGLDGEEITILNISGTSASILSQSVLSSANNRFAGALIIPNGSILRIKYRTTTNRWLLENLGINDGRYVRKDVNDIKINQLILDWQAGNMTATHFEIKNSLRTAYIVNPLGGGIHTWDCWGNSGTGYNFRIGGVNALVSGGWTEAGGGTFGWTFERGVRIQGNSAISVNGGYNISSAKGRLLFIGYNSTPTRVYTVYASGRVEHARSGAENEAIRRDEQRLHYLVSVATAGAVNDQALTDGIFNYRFTAATSITGFANGEIGRRITVQNDNTVNLDVTHQDVASIAANRVNQITAAALSIPPKGKADFEYCTGSRWELVSKNF